MSAGPDNTLNAEQHALRILLDRWGREFVLAFFIAAKVAEDDIARCYFGLEVEAEALTRIQKHLKERMPKEYAKARPVTPIGAQ
jgi:hypothetical protein